MNSAPAQEQQVHSKQSPQGDANVIKPYKTAKSSTQRSFLPFTGLFARKKMKITQCSMNVLTLEQGGPDFNLILAASSCWFWGYS